MDRLRGSPQLWRIGEGATSSPPLTTAVPIHWQDDNQFPPGDPWASAPTSGPPASPGGNRRTAAHFGFRAVRVPERLSFRNCVSPSACRIRFREPTHPCMVWSASTHSISRCWSRAIRQVMSPACTLQFRRCQPVRAGATAPLLRNTNPTGPFIGKIHHQPFRLAKSTHLTATQNITTQ